MKAIVNDAYGLPGGLELRDVDTPAPRVNEVQVRVLAAAVNPGDWDLMHGTPYIVRLSTGLRRPRNTVLGLAIAGRVAAVGGSDSAFSPGDAVYAGIGHGGFAEYACVSVDRLAPMPSNLTFEQAAAVPIGGVTALQAFRDVGRVQPGQRVLINGASGGVGTFAVQIAKALGAAVTGVCSTSNVGLVRSLGADQVIDYTQEDFTTNGQQYDLILDNVGNRSLSELRRALTRRGMLIPNSNKGSGRWLGGYLRRAVQAVVVSPFVPQRLRPFASTDKREDLVALTGLIESGAVTPVIDRTYPMNEAAEALAYYGSGHVRGKVIITIGQDEGHEHGEGSGAR
ncbi:MAG: NAD(P)-dependent alcohol dehydrogenase [Chloroflexi bacterium]|nr:NAD(P)-dependent alcohol dehydrogenase [Chloroflexota bacterium]